MDIIMKEIQVNIFLPTRSVPVPSMRDLNKFCISILTMLVVLVVFFSAKI